MKVTRNLIIRGNVQGVFFRESMCRKAQELGVTGWVRNCRNGTVEAMVQGSEDAIAAMVEWAQRGPEMARVDQVETSAGSGEYTDFERLDTA